MHNCMKPNRKILLIAGLFGLAVWLLDAIADFFVFYRGERFISLLFLDPPPHEIYIRTTILLIFLGFALYASRSINREREISHHLDRALHDKEILLREVHHRVKNNLAVILSLIRLMSENDPSIAATMEDLHARINSIALIHKHLYTSADVERIDFPVYLSELIDDIVELNATTGPRVTIEKVFTPVTIPLDTAVPCGLIVSELLQNSWKHAFVGRDHGTITARLTTGDQTFRLEIRDDGVGASSQPTTLSTGSLGLILVDALAQQIGATVDSRNEHGFVTDITVPLTAT